MKMKERRTTCVTVSVPKKALIVFLLQQFAPIIIAPPTCGGKFVENALFCLSRAGRLAIFTPTRSQIRVFPPPPVPVLLLSSATPCTSSLSFREQVKIVRTPCTRSQKPFFVVRSFLYWKNIFQYEPHIPLTGISRFIDLIFDPLGTSQPRCFDRCSPSAWPLPGLGDQVYHADPGTVMRWAYMKSA